MSCYSSHWFPPSLQQPQTAAWSLRSSSVHRNYHQHPLQSPSIVRYKIKAATCLVQLHWDRRMASPCLKMVKLCNSDAQHINYHKTNHLPMTWTMSSGQTKKVHDSAEVSGLTFNSRISWSSNMVLRNPKQIPQTHGHTDTQTQTHTQTCPHTNTIEI